MPTLARSVAIYVPGLGGGGAERAAAVLASGFAGAGLRTTLLVDFEAEANRGFVNSAVRIVPLSARHPVSVLRLARWLARERPDVVLAVDGAANVKLVLAASLIRAPMPVILSYHGRSDVVRGRLGLAAYRLAPILTRRAARTVCVSEGLARHLVEHWRAVEPKLVCIPNPVTVDSAVHVADAKALAARPPVILAAGRLVPEKGFATLIRAMTHMPAETRLVILGEGPERPALQAAIAAARLGDRVSLPGYAADPWPAYAGAKVFALTSTSEAFGNVVVEALASGLPVVATDCGGPREILDGGRYGTLVPIGDPVALAGALQAALAEPGDPGPRIARAAQFGTRPVVDRYLTLFDAVLARTDVAGRAEPSPAGPARTV